MAALYKRIFKKLDLYVEALRHNGPLKKRHKYKNIGAKDYLQHCILSKLKKSGLGTDELLVVWKNILRPLTEYAAPLWHPGLTKGDS